MKEFADALERIVKGELLDGSPAAVIITPLVNMVARLVVGTHRASREPVEDLLELVRNQLDEAVAHYKEP